MNSSLSALVRFLIPLIITVMLANGCSSSSDSGNSRSPDAIIDENSNGIGEGPSTSDPDSTAQDSTRVDFNIAVPAYVSDALQVRLEWSIKDNPGTWVRVPATWIGDEFWTAFGDFPTDTQYLLIVTFFDRNGDMILGRFETGFKTGTNDSESLRIEANQFDTGSWDDDGDGVSNFDELNAGTDPSMDESAQLGVRDEYHDISVSDALDALARVSGYYESSIPKQRPYNENTERAQNENCLSGNLGMPIARIVDIDVSGTGSFSETYFCDDSGDTTSVEKAASRTRINRSVMWSGTYARSDSSSGVFDEIGFNTETDSIDDQNHKQAGTIDREFRTGSYQASQNISYNLTGRVMEDSSSCEPITGTITNAQQNAYVAVTTITREAGERYWRVSVVDNGQILDEYLISSLGMTFYCAFGD